jgi:thiamine-phosphate pyrophosphorylase
MMGNVSSDCIRELLKVYFIMGSTNCLKDPLEVVREAILGGITLFQFREKGSGALSGKEKYELAKNIQAICKEHGVPFIVNDDIDLAIALDADGVHIGQEDEPASVVREKIGNKILGVSAHTIAEAQTAIEEGADYLGLGPIFPTNTKKDAKAVQGTLFIQTLRKNQFMIPIVGIGGITATNAASVMAAGANGVSVITAISHADSIIEATKLLRYSVFHK